LGGFTFYCVSCFRKLCVILVATKSDFRLCGCFFCVLNTGGGRSGKVSAPRENKAILLLEDKLFQNLQHIVNTIDSMYEKLDHDFKTIVDMCYWDKDGDFF
jgi:hypothetical protein